MDRKNYYPTIVGICDSGEPSIYLSKTGLLSVGVNGQPVIPYSEFVSITGRTDLEPVAPGEAVIIEENAGNYYMSRLGGTLTFNNSIEFRLREAVKGTDPKKYGITTPLIISDEDVETFLRNAIETRTHFDVWCADKEAVRKVLEEEMPQDLKDLVVIDIEDTYRTEYASFMERRSLRLQTRFIITGAVGLLCLVMLYVIQRFRVRDRMGLIAVYRMLGIPGRDSMGLFILENLLLTLRFAVPTVLLAWAATELLPLLGVGEISADIPVWIPLVTILAIAAAQVLVAVLAVLPLIGMPPAKLAAKYDF